MVGTSSACLTGDANGPVRVAQIAAAAGRNWATGVTDAPAAATMIERYGDPDYVLGRAANIQAVAGAFCASERGFESLQGCARTSRQDGPSGSTTSRSWPSTGARFDETSRKVGHWQLEAEDGTDLRAEGAPGAIEKDGARVEVDGTVDEDAMGFAMTGPILKVKTGKPAVERAQRGDADRPNSARPATTSASATSQHRPERHVDEVDHVATRHAIQVVPGRPRQQQGQRHAFAGGGLAANEQKRKRDERQRAERKQQRRLHRGGHGGAAGRT